MKLTLEEVVKATGGRLIGEISRDSVVTRISTDTRAIAKDDLFVALVGEHFDGHDFIKEAYAKGSREFIVSRDDTFDDAMRQSSRIVKVNDTLKAYGDLATFYRQQFKIPAVAVTGSCGKTTVKELIAHLLSAKFSVLRNRGTENNRIGVPKTIFQLEEGHRMLVLEMGASIPGEIETLSSIIQPQVGIVTTVGASHLEGLKSAEGVREEKLKIMKHLDRGGLLIVNGEDPYLKDVQSGVHKIFRVGFAAGGNDMFAADIWSHDAGTSFRLNAEHLIETQLLGRHNALNALIAISVAITFGIDIETIKKSMAAFKPVGGRLCVKTLEGIQFIDDTYNANPVSFGVALETLKVYKTRGRKAVVFGDMLELGAASKPLHEELGKKIASYACDFVIAAGAHAQCAANAAVKAGLDAKRVHMVASSSEAAALCKEMAAPGDLILVKGSRGTHMEKVLECFTTS